MGIPVLEELGTRLRRCMAAGTMLLKEDFRLAKAVDQFEKASAANPVFKKIYEQSLALVKGTSKNPEEELLDLITLVDAVLTTQAAGTVEGEVTPVAQTDSPEYGIFSFDKEKGRQYRYSELMPLYQALTTKGSGRYEVVYTAYNEKNAVLHDVRISDALITGLGDSYSEMAELVKKILQEIGSGVIPALKRGFLADGKQDMVRRLEIIGELAKEEENEFYLNLAKNGGGVVRNTAITLLKYRNDNIPYLFSLYDTERGTVKKAVLFTLSKMKDKRIDDFFIEYLEKHKDGAGAYLKFLDSVEISDYMAEELESFIEELVSWKEKKLTEAQIKRIQILFNGIVNKTSPKMLAALRHLAENIHKFSSLTNEKGKRFSITSIGYYYDMKVEAEEQLSWLLGETAVITENEAYGKYMIDMLSEYGQAFFSGAFYYVLIYHPEQADPMANLYMSGKDGASYRRQVEKCLEQISYNNRTDTYSITKRITQQDATGSSEAVLVNRVIQGKLYNLYKVLFKGKDHQPALSNLFNENDEEIVALYRDYYYQKAKEGRDIFYIRELIRCKNTKWQGIMRNYFINMDSWYHKDALQLFKDASMPLDERIAELEVILSDMKDGRSLTKARYLNKEEFISEVEYYLNNLRASAQA